MKIYCPYCREYILDTTKRFVTGGPYSGDMFSKAEQPRWNNPDYFQFSKSTTGGSLYCPRCEANFIKAGKILTEYDMRDETPVAVVDIESEFVCPVCGKVCKNKCGFTMHMKAHTRKSINEN